MLQRPRARRRAAASAFVALVALAVSTMPAAVVSAGPTTTMSIQPAKGVAGTAIKVTFTINGTCNIGAAALKNPATGNYLSYAVPLAEQNGKFAGTVHVPNGATPGTTLLVEAGCFQPSNTFEGASTPFLVTAPNASAASPGPPPLQATLAITPTSGLPGTAIQGTLTFNPLGGCPAWPAMALRNTPGPGSGPIVFVALTFSLTKHPDGSYTGTLIVPNGATAGTTFYADGGCISPLTVSPPKAFLVTAPDQTQVPWWQELKLGFERGSSLLVTLLSSDFPYPFHFPPPTPTTTRPRPKVGGPTTPTSSGTTTSSSTTSTTCVDPGGYPC